MNKSLTLPSLIKVIYVVIAFSVENKHAPCIDVITNYQEIDEVNIKDMIISLLTLCFKFQLMHMFQKMGLHLLSGFPLTTKT